jgi:hypothetical protein
VAVVLLVGLIPGIVKCMQADVGLGHNSEEKTRLQTTEDSYGSIWASPYGAHGLFSRWRSRQHACFIMIKRAATLVSKCSRGAAKPLMAFAVSDRLAATETL